MPLCIAFTVNREKTDEHPCLWLLPYYWGYRECHNLFSIARQWPQWSRDVYNIILYNTIQKACLFHYMWTRSQHVTVTNLLPSSKEWQNLTMMDGQHDESSSSNDFRVTNELTSRADLILYEGVLLRPTYALCSSNAHHNYFRQTVQYKQRRCWCDPKILVRQLGCKKIF